MAKKRALYFIYNDGKFANEHVGNDCPCLVVDCIESKEKAERILNNDILPRFSDYDKSEFYIVEDYEIVEKRLSDGESIEDIFSKSINLIYY